MTGEPGTTCRLTYDCGTEAPDAGDFIRTAAGTCYQILDVRQSPSRRGRVYLDVVRLGRDAVEPGAPGVWPLYWHRR